MKVENLNRDEVLAEMVALKRRLRELESAILSPNKDEIYDKEGGSEDAGQEQEERSTGGNGKSLHKLMENLPVGIAVTDLQGDVAYFNRKFTELFGYTLNEMPTLDHWWTVAYPDQQEADRIRSEWISAVSESRDRGAEADPTEREVRCKDGKTRRIEFRKIVIGEHVVHTFVDVTEIRSQQEALMEREQMFRLLSEQSLMSVAILQDGVYKYANKAMSDLCEYSLEEILSWSSEQFLEVVHPEDRSLVMSQARMKQLGDTRQKTCYAFRIITKSGDTKWVEIYSKTIQFTGKLANLLTMIDITERTTAEESLRRLENLYRNVIENIEDVFYRSDNQGRLLMGSPSGARLFGYNSVEDMIGLPLDSFWIDPKKRDSLIAEIQKFGRVKDFEGVLKRKDGTTFVASFTTHFYRDENGTIRGTQGIIRDVTARKEAEQEVMRSEERLRLAWETNPDYCSISRLKDAMMIDVNPGFTELTGYCREEAVGKSAFDLHLWVDTSDRMRLVSALNEQGKVRDFETKFRRKDGVIRAMSISAGLIDLGGEPHILGIVKDIEYSKKALETLARSEQLFRKYFELGLVGMALTSPGKGWVYVNDQICDMLGYTRDELLKTTWAELTHPDDLGPDIEKFDLMMAGESEGYSMDKRFVRKDGSVIYTTLHVSCMRYPDGTIENVIAHLYDISDRKQAEDRLKRYTHELETINRLGREIGSSLSVDEIASQGLRELIEVIGCDCGMFFLYKDDSLYLKHFESPLDGVCAEHFPVHRVGECLCGLSVRERRPIFSANINADPRCTWEECKKAGLRAIAVVPLIVRDEVVGVIGLGSLAERDFSVEESFIASLTQQLTMGIGNSLLYERVGHHAWELEKSIAELKSAEESLSASEALLRQVIDLVPHFIFAKDAKGRFLLVNQAVAEAYGTEVEKLTGKTDAAFARSEEEFQHFRSDDLEVISSGKPKAIAEEQITDASGRTRWLNTIKIPFTFAGASEPGVLGVSVDITERRKAEGDLAEALRRSRLQLETISEIAVSPALVNGDTLTLAREISERGAAALGVERAGVWLFSDDRETLTCIDLYERSQSLHSSGPILIKSEYENEFEALETSRYIDSHDALSDPRTAGYVATYLIPLNITSMLDVAVRRGRENLGVICFEHVDKTHRWQPDEIAFACQVADQFSLAMHSHDRMVSEKAIRESELQYRLLAENISDVIWTMTPDLRITYVSPSVERLFGWTSSEWLDFKPSDYLTPDSLDLAAKVLGRELSLDGTPGLDPNRVTTLELEQYRSDGSRIWTETSARFLYNEALRITGIIGATRDITARKRSQEELHRLFAAVEQAGESIMITDLGGKALYVNPAFEETSGYPIDEVLGRTPEILKSGKHNRAFYQDMWTTINRGEAWRGRYTNKKRDGSLYEEAATISPIKDEYGQVVNYVMVGRDVTSEILLQKQLSQAQKMEAIGTLAGGIAHDFNNILQAILGYSDLLLMKSKMGDADRNRLQVIRQAARDGADLVSRILTFSRKADTHVRPLDLNEEIRKAHKLLRRTIPRMIDIRLILANNQTIIDADAAQIEQILLNLGVNAHHAMPEGGRLLIETNNVALTDEYLLTHLGLQPGNYVILTISDTGAGMEPSTLDRIFEPFFTTKTNGEGTGPWVCPWSMELSPSKEAA